MTTLFGCYNENLGSVEELIVSDHHQWHRMICEVYKRLRGHKVRQQSPTQVAQWLFPPVTERH